MVTLGLVVKYWQQQFVAAQALPYYNHTFTLIVAFVFALTSIDIFISTAAMANERVPIVSLNVMFDDLTNWVAIKFDEVPAIMLGVAMALAVLPLAFVGWLMRKYAVAAPVDKKNKTRSIPISGWNARGLLIGTDNSGESYQVDLGLLRIGREEDNDIRLIHTTVHRYHAIVERTSEAEFYIVDVSGDGGNGVRVDGEKIKRARLRGGELIEIGSFKLRFQLICEA